MGGKPKAKRKSKIASGSTDGFALAFKADALGWHGERARRRTYRGPSKRRSDRPPPADGAIVARQAPGG